MYESPISVALHESSQASAIRSSLVKTIKESFISDYCLVAIGQGSALDFHCARLSELQPQLAYLQTNRLCLSCIMDMPEKVLPCGHAVCDNCIRTFGHQSASSKHTFHLKNCLICGEDEMDLTYQLIPSTAGVRILSLDGGGVRGVIPMTFLCHLESTLSWLDCPLRTHFDFACGTSSGMFYTNFGGAKY